MSEYIWYIYSSMSSDISLDFFHNKYNTTRKLWNKNQFLETKNN